MIDGIKSKINDEQWICLYPACFSIMSVGPDGWPLKIPTAQLSQDVVDFLGGEPKICHYPISKEYAQAVWLDRDISDLVFVEVPPNLRKEFVTKFGDRRDIWFSD